MSEKIYVQVSCESVKIGQAGYLLNHPCIFASSRSLKKAVSRWVMSSNPCHLLVN